MLILNDYGKMRFQMITNIYNCLKSCKIRKITFLAGVIFLFVSGYSNAQESKFSTKKIEDLASHIPQKYLADHDTIIPCPEICQSKSLVIQYNAERQVSHIGFSLFSKETKEIINPAVCDFIERLFLELVIAKDKNSVTEILNKSKITLQQNGTDFGTGYVNSMYAILNEIEEPVYFKLENDQISYSAVWNYGNNDILLLRFPANRELIIGTNKKESDGILYDQLKDNQCTSDSIIQISTADAGFLVPDDKKSLYINRGDTFMLPIINANTYYKKTNEGYKLIYDKEYPEESLSNLILGYAAGKNLRLHIRHLMYGNFSPEYEMKLSDFLCFFKNDFNIYTASYRKEAGELKSTVVFQNKQFNYIHLLLISTSESTVFDNEGLMAAYFYSNIPQQSIKNFYGDITKNNN